MGDYLEFSKGLAKEAGEIMLRYFKLGVDTQVKLDETLVTKADTEINSLVIERVKEKYPGTSVYGEEESFDAGSALVWVCDPVDGTEQYSNGVPIAVFSLALVEGGVPVVGVIYDPFTDRLYTGVKGQGALMNGQEIMVSKLPLSYEANIDVEWWVEAQWDLGKVAYKLAVDTRVYALHIGATINAGCLVAAGSYEACLFAGEKAVDIAALKVIVEEAGGKVTDIYGYEQRYDRPIKGAIVSNGICHPKILEYTQSL